MLWHRIWMLDKASSTAMCRRLSLLSFLQCPSVCTFRFLACWFCCRKDVCYVFSFSLSMGSWWKRRSIRVVTAVFSPNACLDHDVNSLPSSFVNTESLMGRKQTLQTRAVVIFGRPCLATARCSGDAQHSTLDSNSNLRLRTSSTDCTVPGRAKSKNLLVEVDAWTEFFKNWNRLLTTKQHPRDIK